MASLVGSRVERKEDKRFLTGKGRYTADINIVNQTYAIFIRSPHARAKIKKIDISKALKSSLVFKLRVCGFLLVVASEEAITNSKLLCKEYSLCLIVFIFKNCSALNLLYL
mgnify:CR=1 FL=1